MAVVVFMFYAGIAVYIATAILSALRESNVAFVEFIGQVMASAAALGFISFQRGVEPAVQAVLAVLLIKGMSQCFDRYSDPQNRSMSGWRGFLSALLVITSTVYFLLAYDVVVMFVFIFAISVAPI